MIRAKSLKRGEAVPVLPVEGRDQLRLVSHTPEIVPVFMSHRYNSPKIMAGLSVIVPSTGLAPTRDKTARHAAMPEMS
jgi:hypothetical protein